MTIFPQIKKELQKFVKDERGTITQENIIKMGAGLSILSVLAADVSAHHVSSDVHSSAIDIVTDGEGTHTTTHSNMISHGQSC